jgi:hypothetical protein
MSEDFEQFDNVDVQYIDIPVNEEESFKKTFQDSPHYMLLHEAYETGNLSSVRRKTYDSFSAPIVDEQFGFIVNLTPNGFVLLTYLFADFNDLDNSEMIPSKVGIYYDELVDISTPAMSMGKGWDRVFKNLDNLNKLPKIERKSDSHAEKIKQMYSCKVPPKLIKEDELNEMPEIDSNTMTKIKEKVEEFKEKELKPKSNKLKGRKND